MERFNRRIKSKCVKEKLEVIFFLIFRNWVLFSECIFKNKNRNKIIIKLFGLKVSWGRVCLFGFYF